MGIDYKQLRNTLQNLADYNKEKEARRKQNNEQDRSEIFKSLSQDLGGILKPYIEELRTNSKMSAEEMSRIIAQSVKIDSPSIDTKGIEQAILGALSSVRISSPSVNIPEIRVPEVKMPKEMDIKGWVSLMGVDLEHPLPVQLRDKDGKAVDLMAMRTILGGDGGGKSDYFTIKGFAQSAFSEIINPDGRVKVELPTGSSGLTDTELRASSVHVEQVSGSVWSVFAALDTTLTLYNADNRLRVSVETGASGLTDAELRASTLDIKQVSGSADSVYARPSAVGDEKTDDVLRVYQVSNSTVSTQAKFIARQTNPTAVADAATVFGSADDLGRQLTRIQARDLVLTAYATLTNGTETTLKAAVVGSYLDLIYVMGANNSDVAVTVDIRAVTGGNIMTSIRIPANGTAGVALPVPLPQDETGNNWTADMGDITGTTVYLSALFSKEI